MAAGLAALLACACAFLAAKAKAEAAGSGPGAKGQPLDAYAAHAKLFVDNQYPPAAACRTCHPTQYRQWSVSSHAYAQLSPVFNAMQATITKLTSGANGDFCIRCHTAVGMNIGEPTYMSNMDRNPTSREGVTCIVCHRVAEDYGKVSGRLPLQTGDLTHAVYGPTGDAELKRVLSLPDTYRVTTNPVEAGRKIHADIKKFFQLTEPRFCGNCHDVTLMNGFRLEEAYSSFKNSTSAHSGVSCQDCHMGLVPGKVSGYAMGPAAVVGGVPTTPRKLTNHMFPGPDYSIICRGFFPHNDKAAALATMREWLTFDDQAGWGTDAFENNVPKDYKFPPRWSSVDDRYDARAILDEQGKLLNEVYQARLAILRVGYQLGDFVVEQATDRGLRFKIQVKNGTPGHNVPTGFDAERISYLQVVVRDARGREVFKSGDLDPNGDVRDLHSSYVHNGQLPLDEDLFTLQSRFITRNVRGGDQEQVLAINYSVDPLPFIRPTTFAVNFTGRPDGARIQRRGIEPHAWRWADYKVKRSQLTGAGPYTVRIRLMSGMVPVNLITEIKVAGFDYGMSPRQVADAIRDGQAALYDKELTLALNGSQPTIDLGGLADTTKPYVQP